MLDEAAATWPSEPYALRRTDEGWKASSFSEVREAAISFAAWLVVSGFAPGEKAAILGEGSPEWIEGEFGALYAGMVSVPLSIKLTHDEILFRLAHSEARIVLTTHNLLGKTLSVLAANPAPIPIVYLDEDIGWARDQAGLSGIGGERVTALSEAVAAGRLALADRSGETGLRLDGIVQSIEEDRLATISYTSGTTGTAKGIMLSHRNFWTNSHDASVLFHTPRFRTLLVLPADHAFIHTVTIFTALWSGVALYFVDGRGGGMASLRNIPLNIQECQPTFLLTVPALSANIMKRIAAGVGQRGPFVAKLFAAGIDAAGKWMGDGYSPPPLSDRISTFLPYFAAKTLLFGAVRRKAFGRSITFCVSGGSKSDVQQEKFFTALGVPFLAGYGLTEASPIVSANTLERRKYGTVGRPVPSVLCSVLDEEGAELPADRIGEIAVAGDSVMMGYYKNPEATADALREGRLLTGDIGFIDKDGFLTVVGRKRALLVSEAGEKYSPETIEEAVMVSAGVVEQVMAWCLYKKYSCALVALDLEKTKALIEEKGTRSAEVLCRALQEEFYRFKTNPKARPVQAAWVPVTFQILGKALGEEDGTINSTMKLVRHRVEAEYRDLIDYSYTNEGSTTVNPRNIATLREMFKL